MNDIAVLDILLHGKPIGTMTQLPGDRNLFAFNSEYIDDPSRPTLSLSFKDVMGHLITEIAPTKTRVPPFFANLLPEGPMREYLVRHDNLNPKREFYLLAVLGNDLPGAIQIGPEIRQLTTTAVDQHKKKWVEDITEEDGKFHFSLAGVQLKFSAILENNDKFTIPVDGVGGSWIVKMASSVFEGVPQNEFSMMELARRIGINVPETALVPLNKIKGMPKDIERVGTHVYAIKRFDRDGKGSKIHIEDFAQVFGVYPENKYRSANYRNIAEVIWTEMGEKGITEFIRRFVFNALIGNGDMHIKNWSLIYPDNRKAELAPAYDFVSTLPYIPEDNLALNFLDSKSFASLTLEQFKRFADKVRTPERLVLDTVRETVERFDEVWNRSDDLPISNKLKAIISTHLKNIPIWNKAFRD